MWNSYKKCEALMSNNSLKYKIIMLKKDKNIHIKEIFTNTLINDNIFI